MVRSVCDRARRRARQGCGGHGKAADETFIDQMSLTSPDPRHAKEYQRQSAGGRGAGQPVRRPESGAAALRAASQAAGVWGSLTRPVRRWLSRRVSSRCASIDHIRTLGVASILRR